MEYKSIIESSVTLGGRMTGIGDWLNIVNEVEYADFLLNF